nr:MAG TPA: Small nuclear ribonucleoprotein Sm D1, Assembly Machinery, SPLICING [Myoviridae sp. ctfA14]
MILFPSIIRFCIFKRSKKKEPHSSHSSFIIVLTLITFIFFQGDLDF